MNWLTFQLTNKHYQKSYYIITYFEKLQLLSKYYPQNIQHILNLGAHGNSTINMYKITQKKSIFKLIRKQTKF